MPLDPFIKGVADHDVEIDSQWLDTEEAEASAAAQLLAEAFEAGAEAEAERIAREAEMVAEAWTTVSGKLLTSEKRAFQEACKAQGLVPSKAIRAFALSFSQPGGEEAEAAPGDVHHCKDCSTEISDDYYRFGDHYTCGPCVTRLIEKKQDEAVESYLRNLALETATGAKEPLPAAPVADRAPEEPAQPPPPVLELERVQCKKCLGEAFVPRGKEQWTCAVCHWLNVAGE